jgi:beta-lactamase regulating signal transducer with metallopeptidase domain/Mg-chelatase subunit ChlD
MPIDFFSQLISASIRASVLGLAAFAVLGLFRVRSSAARHATWTVVLVGMLLQIPLASLAPPVKVKVLATAPAPIQPRVMEPARISVPAGQTAQPVREIRTQSPSSISLTGSLTAVYLAITMLLLARMAFGFWVLRRILRDASPIPGLGRNIFESASMLVPGSVGCFRARILLPPAWKDWETVKLQAVLAHEKAHLRRSDWLIRVVSRVNGCIFWFHPLAWWIERELAQLAEEACDDVALSAMESADQYAAVLVEIARAAAADGGVLNWGVVSMAQEPNVIRRVNRILHRSFQIHKPFSRLAWVTLSVCTLPVIYLSAAVQLAPANRASMAQVAQAAPNRPLQPARPMPPTQREKVPVSMCILIDNAGAMRDKRARLMAAVSVLVQATNPDDEICMIDFNDEAFNELPNGRDFTSDIREMEEALTHIEARGGRAMREAIQMSIDHLRQKAHHDKKVLVVVTQGNDNASTITEEQVLREVKDSGVRVYSIGLLSETDSGVAGEGRRALKRLAEVSGGQDYYPNDLADIERISLALAQEVRRP